MMDTTNKILTIVGGLLVLLQTLIFGYWMHVDSKMATRIDQLYVELINMKKEAK